MIYYVFPLKRCGHVGLPLSAQSVLSRSLHLYPIHLCPSAQRFLSCRRSNTRHWPNAWPIVYDADPILAQYWVTVSCFTSCWMWASVTDAGPTVNQLWLKALCCYHQHKVLIRTEWILPSTGDDGSIFNRHWIGVSLWSVDTPSPTESIVHCWMAYGQSQQRWTSVEPALGCLVCWV